MTRKRSDIPKHGRFNTDGSHTAVAQGQRRDARMLAACIERGEPVSVPDVVHMLRARALQRWRGRPSSAHANKKAAIQHAADCVERGEPFDATLAAEALRGWADALPVRPPPRRGKPPKVDQAVIALEFEAQRRRREVSDACIIGELAEKYDVDVSTIKEARIACGDAARRHFDAMLHSFGAHWEK